MREITSLHSSASDPARVFLSSSLDHNVILWAPDGHTGAIHALRNLNVGAPIISACMAGKRSRDVIAVTVSVPRMVLPLPLSLPLHLHLQPSYLPVPTLLLISLTIFVTPHTQHSRLTPSWCPFPELWFRCLGRR